MDVVLIIFRTLHIFSGVIWFGSAATLAWVMHPVADKMGANGMTMLRTFYGHSRFSTVFLVSAIITVAAGLIIWPQRVNGMDFIGFTNTGDIVMLIGTIAGLLAFGHGATATKRSARTFARVSQQYEDNPTPENDNAVAEAKTKLYLHTNISTWVTLVSVITMSGARYL